MNEDHHVWYSPVRERLVQRRKELGLTQKGAAALAGIDGSTLCRLEGGYVRYSKIRQPGPIVVARWAQALRVDTGLILTLSAAEWDEPFVADCTEFPKF